MLVCICRNISDKEITLRVQDGAQFDDLQIDLGIATCCGCCEECARDVVTRATPATPANGMHVAKLNG